jgi:hypothetical protein
MQAKATVATKPFKGVRIEVGTSLSFDEVLSRLRGLMGTWIQTDAGSMVEELPTPRTAYEGHERRTPWNDLQFLYFVGYAFWNYFTMPFLLASDGVTCEEVEPWEENGQRWRVLKAAFDPLIDVHCAVQKFYFDGNGMLQRNDYFTDVAKGNVAHYCTDYRNFDGFIFPTRRRVVGRGENDRAAIGGPSSVLIDIESVVVNRAAKAAD